MSKLNGKWINKDTDNLTHDGDDLAVLFSDDEAPDSNKVWSSDKINTISGVLSDEIDADISTHAASSDHDGRYYTESEVDALTWTESDIVDLDKYTQAEVDTISGTLQDQIDAIGGVDEVEYITIDADDISNKYTVLSHTPYAATEVMLDIVGGCAQLYTTDFTVIDNTHLNWNGLGLDGVIETGDKIRVSYTYNI